MNIDDLEWQERSHAGGVPPAMAERLVGLGRLDLVIRAAAERGEWFCAVVAVRELCAVGDFDGACTAVEPFAATGWKPAVVLLADVLFQWGRTEEALALVRPAADVQDGREWREFALMLARAGRVDDAIEVLVPHLRDWWLVETLVDLTEGQGRDEQVLELLDPLAEAAGQCGANRDHRHEPWNAQELRARVLERTGRADEAIRTLGADVAAGRYLSQNTLTCYAELLARHGRIEELRILGTGAKASAVLGHYAKALEDAGRAQEAEVVLREFLEITGHDTHRISLIGLLSRQGRIDEAVEVGRPTFEYDGGWNQLDLITQLLVEDGRPERALELLDERSASYVQEHLWWLRPTRLRLLAEAGRLDQAVAEAKALTVEECGERDCETARLLARNGCVEEAVELLRSSAETFAPQRLAELLIEQGRAEEAIAALPPVSVARRRAEERRRADPSDMDLLFDRLLAAQDRDAATD
ncbi:tetratricopeptide repeat protein [Kitasatospora sp. NPDC059673]|uniref:tetratricopeptide repeat protein n=1 Tax=Kitasatospora sp. NPDC059673 TaxID=3346901 RepID=UPI0036975EE6